MYFHVRYVMKNITLRQQLPCRLLLREVALIGETLSLLQEFAVALHAVHRFEETAWGGRWRKGTMWNNDHGMMIILT